MSNEILQPFQLNSAGGIAMTSDPNVQTGQHLMSLLGTSPSERVMLATYGTGVKNAVFTGDNSFVGGMLKTEINTAVGVWEPNVTVNSITVNNTNDPQDPTSVTLDWSINQVQSGSSTGVQHATILVGGTVVTD